jgi:hypothetical protein
MEMIFTNGEIMASPSPDIEKVYEGPYYSFFSWSDPPTGSELESVSAAYQLIYDVIEEEGPFDGILGFSQGATLASAFLMHHAEQHPLDLPFVHFKYAIFIGEHWWKSRRCILLGRRMMPFRRPSISSTCAGKRHQRSLFMNWVTLFRGPQTLWGLWQKL